MKKDVVIVIAAVLLCIASITSAQDLDNLLKAKASYYKKPYSPTFCFGEKKMGIYIALVSNDLWENGKACGQIYRVWCHSSLSDDGEQACLGYPLQLFISAYVRVIDKCNDCYNGTIRLSEEAFEMIARKETGNIQVVYNRLKFG